MNNCTLKVFFFLFLYLSCGDLKAQVDVLTQHGDIGRTGWNSSETQLNLTNVSPTGFGLLFKQSVDDQIYAQPLIVSGVNIGGGTKNVIYVCTVNNSVYAFDADNGAVPAYWKINLTPANMRPPNTSDEHTACGNYVDFNSTSRPSGQFGIVGTPVIDKSSNTLFVVSRYVDPTLASGTWPYPPTGFYEIFHAIDLTTGADKIAPVTIQATVNGTAPDNVSGQISFDSRKQNQRAGLLLLNGVVYIPFASHCDWDYYHGWLLAYNASNLQQLTAFMTTPNDGRGGIWMSGGGPAAENIGNGNIYLAAGNSANGDPTVLQNRGESILKLIPNQAGTAQTAETIADYFTPTDYGTLNGADDDFGSQVLPVPNTNLLVTGCKDGNLYILDKTNLGGYNMTANNIINKIPIGTNAQFHSSLAYFGGATTQYVYSFPEQTNLTAFPVLPGLTAGLDAGNTVTGNIQGGNGNCGSFMSVSSNGTDESTGILWIANSGDPTCNANTNVCPGILYAVNASNVSKLLWSSNMNPGDAVGSFAKNVCPTVANGKIYLATFSNTINVYGLLASNPTCVTNVALNQPAIATSNQAEAANAFDGNMNTYWQSANSNTESIYVDLGGDYDICKVDINWGVGQYATNFIIESTGLDPVANPNSWMTIDSVVGNASVTSEYVGSFTGRYIRMRGKLLNGNSYIINEMQVYGQPSTACAAPAGLTASSITQNTAQISWTAVPNATGYNVSYQNTSINSYITRNNLTTTSLGLTALSCGTPYKFRVQAICSGGQTSALDSANFTTAACTAPCGVLPTRHHQADIGDIGIAGSSCYNLAGNDSTYTISGSGADIGGVNDEFQYMYFSLVGDDSYSVQVGSQDATNANNKAGIMMKSGLSNTAPFAFVGLTSSSGAVFIYRSTDGASATSVYLPGVKAPYYIKMVKSGTQYSGYVSADGLTNWQQVGTTANLSFGAGTIDEGLAVTSADNSLLSTAVFNSFQSSAPLPITLVSFTAQNINNQYVALNWITASEENNSHFTIERSSDGVHFTLIATVKAVGNSSINQTYNYSDLSPVNGVNFYRLKQYDIDGRMAEFPVVQVNFGLNGLPIVYPNPATTTIYIASGKELVKTVRLSGIDGKEIEMLVNSAGLQQVKMDVTTLSAGVYILEIKTFSNTYQQKIIKE